MSVTRQDVQHIASLARLEIPESRLPVLVDELNGILAHMDVLQRVELDASSERDRAGEEAAMPLRPDIPGSVALERERATFAPAFREGFFLVPRLSTHE